MLFIKSIYNNEMAKKIAPLKMTFDNLAIDFCPKANPVSFLLHQH